MGLGSFFQKMLEFTKYLLKENVYLKVKKLNLLLFCVKMTTYQTKKFLNNENIKYCGEPSIPHMLFTQKYTQHLKFRECLIIRVKQRISFYCSINLRKRGYQAVYSTSPQSLIISFSYSLAQQPWGLLFDFDWLGHLVECPNVSTTNCNLKKV